MVDQKQKIECPCCQRLIAANSIRCEQCGLNFPGREETAVVVSANVLKESAEPLRSNPVLVAPENSRGSPVSPTLRASKAQWSQDASALRKASNVVAWIMVILNTLSIIVGAVVISERHSVGLAFIVGGFLGIAIGSLIEEAGDCLAALVEQGIERSK